MRACPVRVCVYVCVCVNSSLGPLTSKKGERSDGLHSFISTCAPFSPRFPSHQAHQTMALIPLAKAAPPVISAVALAAAAYKFTPTWSRPVSETQDGWSTADARYRMAVPRQGSDKPSEFLWAQAGAWRVGKGACAMKRAKAAADIGSGSSTRRDGPFFRCAHFPSPLIPLKRSCSEPHLAVVTGDLRLSMMGWFGSGGVE